MGESLTERIQGARTVRSTCQGVVDALLSARRRLLHEGWPASHELCQLLDQHATRWAAQTEAQRRLLLDLERQIDTDRGGTDG